MHSLWIGDNLYWPKIIWIRGILTLQLQERREDPWIEGQKIHGDSKTRGEILEILNLAQFQEGRIYSTLQVTIKEQQSLFSLL